MYKSLPQTTTAVSFTVTSKLSTCPPKPLESHYVAGLETQVSLEILSDLTDQMLEAQFVDQKLSLLLVTTDLTENDGTGTIPMGFLTPPVAGVDLQAALVDNCFLGALPLVDLRAVCLEFLDSSGGWCKFAARRPGSYPLLIIGNANHVRQSSGPIQRPRPGYHT